METIKEKAYLIAQQIINEINLSKHSVDKISEIIAEKIFEQETIDIEKACKACENELRRLKTLINENVSIPINFISVGKSLARIRLEMLSSTD